MSQEACQCFSRKLSWWWNFLALGFPSWWMCNFVCMWSQSKRLRWRLTLLFRLMAPFGLTTTNLRLIALGTGLLPRLLLLFLWTSFALPKCTPLTVSNATSQVLINVIVHDNNTTTLHKGARKNPASIQTKREEFCWTNLTQKSLRFAILRLGN